MMVFGSNYFYVLSYFVRLFLNTVRAMTAATTAMAAIVMPAIIPAFTVLTQLGSENKEMYMLEIIHRALSYNIPA